ncbi:Outer membrane protein TolC [Algoriphagus locisalis]|uniref:Outer membrane protein TolC n=1 Tax=Algoriphagus locisalis TaxID=305507 RepID=A0A1I7DVI4_9BACT|nr:TolC family protein [Algoriphagus locisalis]SFU15664.1 Outer membrane protein TolC [Algoriphagus locisalis]
MFKSTYYLLTFLALGLFKLEADAQEIPPTETLQLNLKETLEFALENNVDAKNARLEILVSETTIKEETAAGLPQVNGSFGLNYNPLVQVMFVPNEGPFADPNNPSDVVPLRFGVRYNSNLGVTVSQMIFDGSFFIGLRAAKTYKALTEFDRVKVENDVIENVKKAYFGVLVNAERIKLSEANLSRIDSLLEETTAMYEAGFSEKLDVSRIKVQRNNTYSQYERSRTAYEISKELLKIQMGLPEQYDIVITETLRELNPEQELRDLLAQEGVNRVEMDQLNTNIELTELDLKNNTVQYMPTLDFNGSFSRSGAGDSFSTTFDSQNWFSSSMLGIALNIPIFDGFSKSARIQRNRLQLRQLENQRFFLDQNIELEIFQAKQNLANDLKVLLVQRESMELAQEVYDMSRIKYNEGVGSNFEVVEADSDLIEAEINYLSALYDGLISKIDLEKALGIIYDELAKPSLPTR